MANHGSGEDATDESTGSQVALRYLSVTVAVVIALFVGLVLAYLGGFARSVANAQPQDENLLTRARILMSMGFIVWGLPLVYFACTAKTVVRAVVAVVGALLVVIWLLAMATMSLDECSGERDPWGVCST